jgi:hypothetical protein
VRLLLLAFASLAGSGGLSVGVSNSHPAARPVALKLKFGSELQCGQPVGPPLTVTLPAAERVPRKIAPSTVVVNGGKPSSVTVAGRMLTIRIPRPEVLCDVIGPGTIAITFTRASNLGNPARIGTYHVSVHRGTQVVTGTLAIHT